MSIVLIETRLHHVCSDNAMIDSGTEEAWLTWDGSTAVWHTTYTGRGIDEETRALLRSLKVDASADEIAAYNEYARQYNAAVDFVCEIRKLSQFHPIVVGGQVEVFAGRKAPRGFYKVTGMGDGSWGPYCHIENATHPYRYISRNNIRPIVNPNWLDRYRADYRPFIATYHAAMQGYNNPAEKTVLLVFADYCEERGEIPQLRHVAWALPWLLKLPVAIFPPCPMIMEANS